MTCTAKFSAIRATEEELQTADEGLYVIDEKAKHGMYIIAQDEYYEGPALLLARVVTDSAIKDKLLEQAEVEDIRVRAHDGALIWRQWCATPELKVT
jgi:hypothetical protein